jgi:3-isopropylmalate dehydrogenase
MKSKSAYDIAVVYGDGVGPEVCGATVEVLKAAFGEMQVLNFIEYQGGAATYLETGSALPAETFEGCSNADAILHGAAGLPSVVHPDGTEAGMDFGLPLRFNLDLYANVRYIKLYKGTTSHLRFAEPGNIDYVILRENVEGLYASRGGGVNLRDEVATDTLVITREGTERIVRMAFELARKRNGAPEDGKSRVTICDKANVLRSYAFFRKVSTEVAKDYPDVELEYAIVDALTAYMVTRPEHYDVIVSENMFGDIISDLGAATVGGLGLSPTAEIGDDHGYFQAAHGSAPDIAGKGIANPTGTILSGALMLEWLSERYDDPSLKEKAGEIQTAVEGLLADGTILTRDLGGTATTQDVTDAICKALA